VFRPFGYPAFVRALRAVCGRAVARETHELGYFCSRLSGAVWRSAEITGRGVQLASLLWRSCSALPSARLIRWLLGGMRSRLRRLARPCSGAGSSTGAEPGAEILKRLLEADDVGVEFTHGACEAVLGEMLWLHIAGSRDQLHRPQGGLVASVDEHVEVGMREPAPVELARGVGKGPIRHLARLHECAHRVAEWLVAGGVSGDCGQPANNWTLELMKSLS
jgi:hypothetical protein